MCVHWISWGARDGWDPRVRVDGPELRSADPLRLLLRAGLLRLRDWLQPACREERAVVKAPSHRLDPAGGGRPPYRRLCCHPLVTVIWSTVAWSSAGSKSPGPVGTANAAEEEQPKDRRDPEPRDCSDRPTSRARAA